MNEETWTREQTIEWLLQFQYDSGWHDGFISGVGTVVLILLALVVIWAACTIKFE